MDKSKINAIRVAELKKLDPRLHKKLIIFCSSFDQDEYPEATMIAKGKYKTLHGLEKLYKKLKRKRNKEAKKKLKEAEKLILSANALRNRSAIKHKGSHVPEDRKKRQFKQVAEGQDTSAPLHEGKSEKVARLLRGAIKEESLAEKALASGDKRKASGHYYRAHGSYEQAFELTMEEQYKKKSVSCYYNMVKCSVSDVDKPRTSDYIKFAESCEENKGFSNAAYYYFYVGMLETDPKKKFEYLRKGTDCSIKAGSFDPILGLKPEESDIVLLIMNDRVAEFRRADIEEIVDSNRARTISLKIFDPKENELARKDQSLASEVFEWMEEEVTPEQWEKISKTPSEAITVERGFLWVEGEHNAGMYFRETNIYAIAGEEVSEASRWEAHAHEQIHRIVYQLSGYLVKFKMANGSVIVHDKIKGFDEGITELRAQQRVGTKGHKTTYVAYYHDAMLALILQKYVGADVLRQAHNTGDFTEVCRIIDNQFGIGTFSQLLLLWKNEDAFRAMAYLRKKMSREQWSTLEIRKFSRDIRGGI